MIANRLFLPYVRFHDDDQESSRHSFGQSTETQRCGLARAPRGEREALRDGRAGRPRFRGLTDAEAIGAAGDSGSGTHLEAAWATTDTTLSRPLGTVTDIVSGTGGQLAAALAVGAALGGSVLRFNAAQLAGAVGASSW